MYPQHYNAKTLPQGPNVSTETTHTRTPYRDTGTFQPLPAQSTTQQSPAPTTTLFFCTSHFSYKSVGCCRPPLRDLHHTFREFQLHIVRFLVENPYFKRVAVTVLLTLAKAGMTTRGVPLRDIFSLFSYKRHRQHIGMTGVRKKVRQRAHTTRRVTASRRNTLSPRSAAYYHVLRYGYSRKTLHENQPLL
jgi:hypothetical protein